MGFPFVVWLGIGGRLKICFLKTSNGFFMVEPRSQTAYLLGGYKAV
ncbi:hypothetical protein HMPREF9123_2452 [Neisseria bacilliformis ATCC BAA-1200]|uniref:Uncharacterized protein n=1 Tax=Neisseria bacilliformis ATCC BAA-1200 TaxID=888742 RepID=F2BFE5_9NEIS|nr:hypothetical protein HMPREF9123_2452 [Neisseria bacilliformis ATCC BAA-1200]